MGITNNAIFEFVKDSCGVPKVGACQKGYSALPAVKVNTGNVYLDALVISSSCGYAFVDTDAFWVNTLTTSVADLSNPLYPGQITLLKTGKLLALGYQDGTNDTFDIQFTQSGLVDWTKSYGSSGSSNYLNASSIDSTSNIYTTVNTSDPSTGYKLGGIIKLNTSGSLLWDNGKTASGFVACDGLAVSSLDKILGTYYNEYAEPVSGGGPYDTWYRQRIGLTVYNNTGTIAQNLIFKGTNPDLEVTFDAYLNPTYSPTSWDKYYLLSNVLYSGTGNCQTVATDKLGNFYVPGSSYSLTWDSISGEVSTYKAGTITQVSSTGTVGFNKSIVDFLPSYITEDNNGDIYLLGTKPSDASSTTYILKINHLTFNIDWQHSFPDITYYGALSVSVDCSLNLYFEIPQSNTSTLFFKMTPTGSILWARILNVIP